MKANNSQQEPLRAGVVGVGHAGSHHAREYALNPKARLVAVADVLSRAADSAAEAHGARALSDHREMIGLVDVVSVAVPTRMHYKVARDLLEAGIDVLVEKPFTATLTEARGLLAVAKAQGRLIQVGHIERYNAVTRALGERIGEPMFIESHRIGPFQLRGTDVCVVLDLMIHDIDLIRSLVKQPVKRILASGGAVLSAHVDVANARIEFANGCVGNVTASRISRKKERSMRIFEQDCYFSADFLRQSLLVCRKQTADTAFGLPRTYDEEVEIRPGNALALEIDDFLDCVLEGRSPLVGPREGLEALEIAFEIIHQLEANPLPGQRDRARVSGLESLR